MILEYRNSIGIKKSFPLIHGKGCIISSDDKDDIYVKKLLENAKVSVFQEGSDWVMMALNCEVLHGEKSVQSLVLQPDVQINIGGQNFSVRLAEDNEKDQPKPLDINTDNAAQVNDKENPSKPDFVQACQNYYSENPKFVLSISFVLILIWFVFFSPKDNVESVQDQTVETQVKELELSAPKPTSISEGAENPLTTVESQDSDKLLPKPTQPVQTFRSKEDSAYQYYRSALSLYELGLIKQAVEEIQLGLAKYPNNKILLDKLNEWQERLNILISETYRDACKHALYLRNLEASQAFALVVAMSIDKQDIRYKESTRMHKELQKSKTDIRLECGAKL